MKATVFFGRKTIEIDFDPRELKLSQLADILHAVGYPPLINLDAAGDKQLKTDKSLIYRLAVAGFCFGNVMLFSFPEYLGIDKHDELLIRIFGWLNLLLSLPVFFYSGAIYFTAAFRSFKQKTINIDVPIAAGLLALFLRSGYDIITTTGPGYLDSFTGLVFFLLVGRWFQGKT
ncbi:MAG: heavy metal translocating P-type ATPase, partial [Bacteroidota bacterium]